MTVIGSSAGGQAAWPAELVAATRSSECFEQIAVHLERRPLLQELDLQHEFQASLVLDNLAANSGQRPADDTGPSSRLQPLFAADRLTRLEQAFDVPQLPLDLALIVDFEKSHSLPKMKRLIQFNSSPRTTNT